MKKTIEVPGMHLPEIDDATRREFLIGAAGLLLLAPYGCGSRGDDQDETSGETRTVKHALGTTEVPVNPKRIVVLGAFENLLALGVRPVGVGLWGGYELDEFPEFIEDRAEGVELLGNEEEPNLERMITLEPDLILGEYYHEGLYDQLSQIAPTALFFEQDWNEGSWKNRLRWHAEILGVPENAERLLRDYDQRIREFRDAMGERLEETTVSVVDFLADEVRIYAKNSWSGVILEDAGLSRPPVARIDEWGFPISQEKIPDVDADVIFVIQEPDSSLYRQYAENPLWSRLEAVKQDRVYEASYEVWIGSSSIISANIILDDLNRHLLEGS